MKTSISSALMGSLVMGASMAYAESVLVFDLGAIRQRAAVYDISLARDGRVLVPDLTQNKVIILDKHLKMVLKTFEVPSPHAVIEDSKGFFYVGTHRSGRIRKFDRNYKEIVDWDRKIYEVQEMKAPVAIELGPDNVLYVCDWILQRVIQLNERGELMRVFEDGAIKAKAQFQAHGLAVDLKRQRVYVADRGNDGGNGAIHSFTMDGRYLATWPKPAADFDPFTVRALTENLFVVPNYTDGAFYIFDFDGNLLEKWGALGNEPGKFNRATSVISDGKGYLYVPELNGNRIQRIDFNPVINRLNARINNS